MSHPITVTPSSARYFPNWKFVIPMCSVSVSIDRSPCCDHFPPTILLFSLLPMDHINTQNGPLRNGLCSRRVRSTHAARPIRSSINCDKFVWLSPLAQYDMVETRAAQRQTERYSDASAVSGGWLKCGLHARYTCSHSSFTFIAHPAEFRYGQVVC